MRKVLIITYYWPPAGGSGVQRWLKFSKYLPEFGWEPIIYTPSNPEFDTYDLSLNKDISPNTIVLKRSIWEPYGIYKKLKGSKTKEVNPINSERNGLFNKISLWVRANLFIPDPRASWVRPSVKFLTKYIQENNIDTIVSTGPPHSMHLIARGVKRKIDVRWIADFRDPWTRNFDFKNLPLTHLSKKKYHRLENSVLKEADAIVTVSNFIRDEFETMVASAGGSGKVYTIRNGFDYDDFTEKVKMDESFCFTYTGLFAAEANTDNLWRVLGKLIVEDSGFKKNLRIRLVGKIDSKIIEDITKEGLLDNLENLGYLPHSEVNLWQYKARFLILPTRKEPEAVGILTGKFFEYLATGRTILCFGPKNGELAVALRDTRSGEIFDWEDEQNLRKFILQKYQEYLNPNRVKAGENPDISKYSRRELSRGFSDILNKE